LFAIDRARSHAPDRAPEPLAVPSVGSAVAGRASVAPIVVDVARKQELVASFERAEGRSPDAGEQAQLVREWVQAEILFREGLARGLERDDPVVRERVAAKMGAVLAASLVETEPTEAELRAHHEAHRERWDKPPLIDFVQVFVEGRDRPARERAGKLLVSLAAGADPGGLGDAFPGGRRYRQRALRDLAASFGDRFVEGLGDERVGAWTLHESRFGLHLVRIEKATEAVREDFTDVRVEVAEDYVRERRNAALAARLQELEARYRVQLPP
jgi:hypothetical protein